MASERWDKILVQRCCCDQGLRTVVCLCDGQSLVWSDSLTSGKKGNHPSFSVAMSKSGADVQEGDVKYKSSEQLANHGIIESDIFLYLTIEITRSKDKYSFLLGGQQSWILSRQIRTN